MMWNMRIKWTTTTRIIHNKEGEVAPNSSQNLVPRRQIGHFQTISPLIPLPSSYVIVEPALEEHSAC